MEERVIKSIVKVGNSAGVILPREWLNGKARVELIEKPLDIKKEVFEILEPYLHDIQGIYLVGSYARGEETKDSDVDILVITNSTSKVLENGKYNLTILTKEKIENALDNLILPILPMLKEAKPLLNDSLIEPYKNSKLTKKNLKYHFETTQSAMNVNKESIEIDKQVLSESSDATAYSLILRLREIYIVDCLIRGRKWSNKGLKKLIKKITGSLRAYDGYIRAKNKRRTSCQ